MPVIRQIAQLGHPVLRRKSEPVTHLSKVQPLIDDMLMTMAESNGIGIAAPQVYESLRIVIVASWPTLRYPQAPKMDPLVMINPEILWSSEDQQKDWEGCLSVPGIRGFVPRHHYVKVRYLTREEETQEHELVGFIARIFQHEFDHLEGFSYLDRLENTQDIITEKEFQKLFSQ